MNPIELAEKARKLLGKFCYEECMAYCCRKGHITLTKQEADLITGNNIEFYLKFGQAKESGKNYKLSLEKGCPALKDFKCKIHKNPLRPSICKNFPIFVEEDTIMIARRCHGIDRLYPIWLEAKKNGIKIKYC